MPALYLSALLLLSLPAFANPSEIRLPPGGSIVVGPNQHVRVSCEGASHEPACRCDSESKYDSSWGKWEFAYVIHVHGKEEARSGYHYRSSMDALNECALELRKLPICR